MKIGISVKIDVTKIDKSRLFKGEKGTYLDLTTFIDLDQKDKFDNNGFISQSVSKEEREQNIQTPILGNVKVFFSENQSQPVASKQSAANNQPVPDDGFDDDIPF